MRMVEPSWERERRLAQLEAQRRPSTASAIDSIMREAGQAETARQRQQETENKPMKQLTRTDLQSMTPAEINKAREDGQLDDLLRGAPPQAVLSPAELRIKQLEYDGITQLASIDGMTSAQIVTAHRGGRLTALLTGIDPTAERAPDAIERAAAAQRWSDAVRDAVNADG